MKTVSVEDFANSVNIPVDKLLAQLAEAGVEVSGADSQISSEQKTQLLLFLRKSHGVESADTDAKPRKVTLRRNVTSELRQSGGAANRSRLSSSKSEKVSVTVRKKRTFIKREEVEEVPEIIEEEVSAVTPADASTDDMSPGGGEENGAVPELAEVSVAERGVADAISADSAGEQPEVVGVKPEANVEAGSETATAAKDPSVADSKPTAAPAVVANRAVPTPVKEGERGARKKSKQAAKSKSQKGNVLGGLASKRRRSKAHRPSSKSTEHAFEMPTGVQVKEIEVGETITVAELASRLTIKAGEVIKALMKMGQMVTINQVIDQDMAILVAEEMGHKASVAGSDNPEDDLTRGLGEVEPRPPVITVMGHVDHGKTTLLDHIRNARVAAGESGGITQHIGAYHVATEHGAITFLDTPGHEAFSAMRQRGAKLTDIVVLVVAADDGVMPQTLEAIAHAHETGVPIVVAVNKMDKEGADPDRVKQELSSHGVAPDDWGGDAQFVEISAKTGAGVDDLLEALTVQAELLELTAPAEGPGRGTVIESRLDRGRGPVATVLVQQGLLSQGNIVLAGSEFGRARVLTSDSGQKLLNVGPSIPVEIVGLSGAPEVGDEVNVVADEKKAREIAGFRRVQRREKELASQAVTSTEDIFSQLASNKVSILNVIIKADVRGSSEALVSSLMELPNDEVAVKVLHSGVGAITETDVNLAISGSALIIGFNVRADATARKLIQDSGIDLRYHSIIYEVIDDVRQALTGMLAPEFSQQIIGLAQVREVFRSPKYGDIAGSMVTEGRVRRDAPIRVLRDDVVVYEGELESLRRFKDDVQEVKSGTECGIGVSGYDDVQPGDQIECFERVQVERKL
ncbi:MAG: translation initiation factor IF-2 [Gammaproteobacteria bacterium]|nr:MAG: translation initiation factor IF-2 [Gammaproteobacteria bacterium]RLA15238.1 MAG: translation initiation factor IF-2 [Gammaproteobacteria bacterium]